MFSNKLNTDIIHITREMHIDYKFTRSKYTAYLEEQKEKNEKTGKDNQRTLITKEIDSLKVMIAEKEKTKDSFEDQYFKAMGDAECKKDMIYVEKANSLKRSREETVETLLKK